MEFLSFSIYLSISISLPFRFRRLISPNRLVLWTQLTDDNLNCHKNMKLSYHIILYGKFNLLKQLFEGKIAGLALLWRFFCRSIFFSFSFSFILIHSALFGILLILMSINLNRIILFIALSPSLSFSLPLLRLDSCSICPAP